MRGDDAAHFFHVRGLRLALGEFAFEHGGEIGGFLADEGLRDGVFTVVGLGFDLDEGSLVEGKDARWVSLDCDV